MDSINLVRAREIMWRYAPLRFSKNAIFAQMISLLSDFASVSERILVV